MKCGNMVDKGSLWSTRSIMRWEIVLITAVLHVLSAECKCTFPKDWKGRWFQSGLGEVIIRKNVINQKGACYEHHRDYFLLENKERECFQCLLLIKRHKNIIQYKESYCIQRDTLRSICSQIRVETPLYTLVKEPSSPTRCPFQDAYYFNYNDHVSGFCDQPISYAKPCVGQNKFRFHFKHCDDIATWNGRDLDFDCLATWKDGSEMYMYGRYSGPGIQSKDESYRCFKYQYYGSEVFMSMSVDATCRGLRTARDGPFIMELTKDIFGWPPPSCQFPEWLTSREWRDVDGKHSYVSDDRGEIISGFYRRRVNSKPHLHNEYKCVEVLEHSEYKQEYILLSFATHACLSKHQCIKIRRRADNVVELYKGNMVDYETNSQCLVEEEYQDVQILIPEDQEPIDCPQPGLYQMESADGCIQHLNIGCENRSRIDMQSSCKNTDGFSLECLALWPGATRTYFIARGAEEDSRLVNCFSIRPEENVLQFGTDKECNEGISNLFNGALKHSILFNGHCKNGAGSTDLVIDLPKGNNGDHPGLVGIEDVQQASRYTTKIPDDEYNVQDSATVSSRVNDPYQGQADSDAGGSPGVISGERGTSSRDPSANVKTHSDRETLKDVKYDHEELNGNPQRSKGNGSSHAGPAPLPAISLLWLCLSVYVCACASLR